MSIIVRSSLVQILDRPNQAYTQGRDQEIRQNTFSPIKLTNREKDSASGYEFVVGFRSK